MSIPHVAAAVFGTPWFVTPEAMGTIAEVVGMRQAGIRLTAEQVTARLEAAAAQAGPRGGTRVVGAVGVLPIYGTIFHRSNLMSEFSGGATVQGITQSFRQAMADDSIGSVVLEFDSPGGEVSGIDELASEIRAARGRKPIVAVANTLMASAAYYLASQADEIVAAPWSLIGSIGTVVVHQEFSKMDEAMGVTTTIIRRPDTKYQGNDLEPLTDSAREVIQGVVDDAYDQFVAAVAKGRGVTVAAVKAGYGNGDVLPSQRARSAGLVDRVATLDDTIRRLSGAKAASGTKAGGGASTVQADADVLSAMGVTAEEVGALESDDLLAAEAEADAGRAAMAARLQLDADAWLFRS